MRLVTCWPSGLCDKLKHRIEGSRCTRRGFCSSPFWRSNPAGSVFSDWVDFNLANASFVAFCICLPKQAAHPELLSPATSPFLATPSPRVPCRIVLILHLVVTTPLFLARRRKGLTFTRGTLLGHYSRLGPGLTLPQHHSRVCQDAGSTGTICSHFTPPPHINLPLPFPNSLTFSAFSIKKIRVSGREAVLTYTMPINVLLELVRFVG